MQTQGQSGFSLIETMVSMTVVLLVMAALAGLLIQNSKINMSQQMAAEVQANARNTLAMVMAKLRTAGWDPSDADIPNVIFDDDYTDDFEEIEVFADLDGDGITTGDGEQILIRYDYVNEHVSWRSSATADEFTVLSINISNDEDRDGNREWMFVADDLSNPTRITIQLTARSPRPDPTTGRFLTYSVSSDIYLRGSE